MVPGLRTRMTCKAHKKWIRRCQAFNLQLVRLGILPEALKQRDDPMLTRQELVKLIEAWPDESGGSSDPEAYNAWMEIEKKHFGV